MNTMNEILQALLTAAANNKFKLMALAVSGTIAAFSFKLGFIYFPG